MMAMRAESDPGKKLTIYAAAMRAIHGRLAPLLLALRDAAATDPEATVVWREISDRRAANMRRLVEDLAAAHGLRDDLTVDDAADFVWTTNSPEVYVLLTTERGWTPTATRRGSTTCGGDTCCRPDPRSGPAAPSAPRRTAARATWLPLGPSGLEGRYITAASRLACSSPMPRSEREVAAERSWRAPVPSPSAAEGRTHADLAVGLGECGKEQRAVARLADQPGGDRDGVDADALVGPVTLAEREVGEGLDVISVGAERSRTGRARRRW